MTDSGRSVAEVPDACGPAADSTGSAGGERGTFLRLIADLSSRFIGIPAGKVSREIDRALADIGRLADVDRAYVIQRDGGQDLHCTHEWCAPGVSGRRHRLQPVPADAFDWIRAELDAGRIIQLADTAEMPADAAKDEEVLRRWDVRALLVAPLEVDGERIGCVGFDMTRGPRSWSQEVRLLLTLTGQMMLGVLQRQHMDESLLASQQRYRDLVENSVEAIIVLDADSNRIVDINDNTARLFRTDRTTLLTSPPEWVLPGWQPDGSDSLERAREIVRKCLGGERLVFDWTYRDAEGNRIPCEVRAVPLPETEGRRIRLSILDVSERKRAEEEQLDYLRRTREQHLRLGQVATSRALADGDLPTLYREVCEAVRAVLGVARASIWRFGGDGTALQCAGLVDAEQGDAPVVEELSVADNAEYVESLRGGRATAVEDTETDSRVAGMRSDYLLPRGIRSMLDAPIRVSGRMVGVVCAEQAETTRVWEVDEIGFVSAMADQVAQALINHERASAAEALRQSEQRYRALYDDNPSMFFTVDEAGFIQSVNRFAAESLGYGVEELVGLPFDVLHDGEAAAAVDGHLQLCYHTPGQVHRWDSSLRRRAGDVVSVRISARVQQDAAGGTPVLIVCEDISEARKLAEELSYQARHDALTGLFNRREFEERLNTALEEAHGRGSEHVLCYLDLDQFKVINDTCGHMAGDELLRQLSAMLRGQVGEGDLLARLGGDEFGVLLEHRSPEAALHVAEKIRESISEFHFSWNGRSFGLGVSIGLVPIDRTVGALHDVMSVADTACYAAKDQGRNRIHVYREDDEELARRHGEMQWVSGIRQALSDNRFRLYYQPIVPLGGTAQKKHYELLLRMQGRDGEMILPSAFLPAAERFNLIPLVDRWVIDQTLSWLEAHPAHLEQLGSCGINLSGLSVGDEEFLNWLLRRLDEARVPAEKICLEITETAAIRNLSVATEFMHRLRALGCRFALDDFGSGLSSFAYLKNLPVDSVKIDGVFVRDMHTDAINHAVVKSINEIGHVMGKQTVAEFVESEEVRAALQRIGVDYGQGIGLAAPQAIDWLNTRGR